MSIILFVLEEYEMEPIAGMISAVRAPSTAAGVKTPPKIQRSEEEGGPIAAARDEYIPEEKREPSGRYWLGNEDGQPRVCFDGPDQDKGADGPEKNAGKAESCTCDTDKVDREIEKLKKKREELESRISSETDGVKIRELEKELARVENELRQKDNDAYRRQHAAYA